MEAEAAGRAFEPPKPAPRTRNIPEKAHNNKRDSTGSSTSTIRDESDGRSLDDDDLSLDDEALGMFAKKTDEDDNRIDAQGLIVRQQLELVSRQRVELELLQEHKQPTPRKRWSRVESLEIKLESWSSSSEDEESTRRPSNSGLLIVPPGRSRASSMNTEFYSMSEDEGNKQEKEDAKHSPVLWQPRLSDGSVRSDPDAEFAAMCEALARKRQQAARGETLPSDLSQVPVELLQSLPAPADCSFDEDELRSRKRVWRRSNSDPGWIIEDDAITHPSSARSVDNFEECQGSVSTDVLPSLNDTFSL